MLLQLHYPNIYTDQKNINNPLQYLAVLAFYGFYVLSLSTTTNNQDVTSLQPAQFDTTFLLAGVSAIYTKDLLQKIMSESLDERHSTAHLILLANTQKLLNNIKLLNEALASCHLKEDEVLLYVKQKLNLAEIINIPSKPLKSKDHKK
jgi:hypothetical protein